MALDNPGGRSCIGSGVATVPGEGMSAMATLTRNITIDAPVEKVFDYALISSTTALAKARG